VSSCSPSPKATRVSQPRCRSEARLEGSPRRASRGAHEAR
jgi:hypothetical protein